MRGNRPEREQVQRADRDVDSVQPDAVCDLSLDVAERDQRERRDGGENRDDRSEREQEPTEVVSRNCSLVSSLRMSASGCRAPYGPTRFGP